MESSLTVFLYIIGNVVAPVVSGVIFLVFASYIFASRPFNSRATSFFILYLFSFGLFVMFRPVQLFAGMHPWPLIINNIRSFILIAVAIPALSCANLCFISTVKRSRLFLIFGLGTLGGIIYILFNIMGTYGSTLTMGIGGFAANEPNLPAGKPPFYSREITIALYMLCGISVLISGFHLLRKSVSPVGDSRHIQLKFILISTGSLVLGTSLFLGALLKTWLSYYISALISALLSGTGILIDLKEIRSSLQKAVPFMKEELTQLIRFQPERTDDLRELVEIVHLDSSINTFAVLELKLSQSMEERVGIFDNKLQDLEGFMNKEAGEAGFFMVPLGKYKAGIAFHSTETGGGTDSLVLCESILEKLLSSDEDKIYIGLGRSMKDITELSLSYQQAVTAQGYASRHQQSRLVHIDDIQDKKSPVLPVLMDLGNLSISIRTANLNEAKNRFNLYFSSLSQTSGGDMDIIRMQSIHLVSLIITDALTAGVSALKLAESSSIYYSKIAEMQDSSTLYNYILDILQDIIRYISSIQSHKNSRLVTATKLFIEKNYSEVLSIQIISQEMGVSPSYLQHLFKKETDFSLVEFINKTRITKAKQMLSSSDATITEIAFEVGFNDSNYFSKVFKKSESVTPGNYRRSTQGESCI